MILTALLLAAAVPAAADDEVVVIAHKLRAISLSMGKDAAGRISCSIDRSSGDAGLDAAMCHRAARCMPRRPLTPAKFGACLDRQRAVIATTMRKRAAA